MSRVEQEDAVVISVYVCFYVDLCMNINTR